MTSGVGSWRSSGRACGLREPKRRPTRLLFGRKPARQQQPAAPVRAVAPACRWQAVGENAAHRVERMASASVYFKNRRRIGRGRGDIAEIGQGDCRSKMAKYHNNPRAFG